MVIVKPWISKLKDCVALKPAKFLKSFLKVSFLAFYNHDNDLPPSFFISIIFLSIRILLLRSFLYNVFFWFFVSFLLSTTSKLLSAVCKSQIINKLALHLAYDFK